MITKFMRAHAQGILAYLATFFLSLGISPNGITLLGFGLVCAISVLVGLGFESISGVLLIFSLGFDAVDGTAARLSKRESKFGAFLDSTLDRWAEAALYLGLFARAWSRSDMLFGVLTFVAFAGSMMVSYTRARAEGIGVECTEGWLTRLERLIILILGLILTIWSYYPLVISVALIAVFANVTAIQRIMCVYRATKGGTESRLNSIPPE